MWVCGFVGVGVFVCERMNVGTWVCGHVCRKRFDEA